MYELKDLCDNEYHLKAGQRYDEMVEKEKEYSKKPPELKKRVEEHRDLQHMKMKEAWVKDVLHDLNADDDTGGWSKPKVKGSLTLRSKLEGAVLTFKIEGTIDEKVFNICSLLYEVDLHPKWVPLVTNAKLLAMPSECGQYASMVFKHVISVPVPGISNREFVGYGFGSNCLHTPHKCVLDIFFHTIYF